MLDQLEIIYKNDVRVNYWECMKTARVLARVMTEGEEEGRPLSSAASPLPPSPEGEGKGERRGPHPALRATFPKGEGKEDGKNDQVKD